MTHLYHKKWFISGSAVTLALFVSLFWIRFYYTPPFTADITPVDTAANSGGSQARETWKSIYIKKEKAGYAVSRLSQTDTGYGIQETAFFRFNTMGMIQEIRMETRAQLKHDFSIESFFMTIRSGLFDFTATGRLEGTDFTITTTSADGSRNTYTVITRSPPYLAGGILLDIAANLDNRKRNKAYALFDPVTMTFLPARAVIRGVETIEAFGSLVDALMVDLEFKGMSQTLWIDRQGRILLETGMLGMRIKAVDREEALSGISERPTQDLTRIAAVQVDTPIPDPSALKQLVIEVSGIDLMQYPLINYRQKRKRNRVTISRETVPDRLEHIGAIPWDARRQMKPGPLIQSDQAGIKDLARSIVQDEPQLPAQIKKLTAWVHDNIEKRPSPSIPDAMSTLKTRKGDCNEHAVLLAALGRAAGIPTRVETGLYYLDGRFMYHAWNAFFLGGEWITADAVFNQVPADVAHIAVATSEEGTGTELAGIIGKITLKIIAME